ncbi:MAG: NADH-quinone oxidoreductase subunit J [Anaerolineales bacterium]|nr:NADH-quinone oxidoreductase subunit J [Anaerolineales bacterium]
MTPDLILFLVLATVAVASALGLIFSRNSVYSALFLILNFNVLAVFYLLLSAPFIAVAQITVYAGAIMVLFLFVIMLLGAERNIGRPTLAWQQPLAIVLALVLLAETGYILFVRSDLLQNVATTATDFGSPKEIGSLLFSGYLLPFEITSILLLAAMVGAIVLTVRAKQPEEQPEENEQ